VHKYQQRVLQDLGIDTTKSNHTSTFVNSAIVPFDSSTLAVDGQLRFLVSCNLWRLRL